MRDKLKLNRTKGVDRTLRKSEILRGRHRFYEVSSKGKNISGKFLECCFRAVPSAEQSSPGMVVGFRVSEKIAGSVIRNRLKRVMREAFRLMKAPVVHDIIKKQLLVEIVFTGTQSAPRSSLASFQEEVQREMESMIQKAVMTEVFHE